MKRFVLTTAMLFSALPSARAAVLTVETTADSLLANADCTLREAIEEANRTAGLAVYTECGAPSIGGADTIRFAAAIFNQTIVTTSPLVLTGDNATRIAGAGSGITIDGTAIAAGGVIDIEVDFAVISGLTIRGGQYGVTTGFSADNLIIGGPTAADGNTIREATFAGILLGHGSNNVIRRNTILDNNPSGIFANVGGPAIIELNYVGVDAANNIAGNGEGIVVASDALVTLRRNIIGGNTSDGVRITDSTLTELRENRIGVDLSGTIAIPNGGCGVEITGESVVTIGGPNPADRNYISGNVRFGVLAFNTSVVELRQNRIGTDLSGLIAIPNGGGVSLGNTASGTLIRNLISGNNGWGVTAVAGTTLTMRRNAIGTTTTALPLPNTSGGVFTEEEIFFERNVVAFHAGNGVHIAPGGGLLVGSEQNCITGNGIGLYDDSIEDISIIRSWWGDASGPSDFGGGSGDPLTVNNAAGLITFLPVLAAPPPGCP